MKKDIIINVEPSYIAEGSNPLQSYFLFSYSIKIINNSSDTVKLLSRYWHIKDGTGVRIFSDQVLLAKLQLLSRTVLSHIQAFVRLKLLLAQWKDLTTW